MSDVARAHLLIPIGTQVVTRGEIKVDVRVMPPGAVGVILDTPTDATHGYRVRFPDGTQAMLRRSQLSIRRHVQASIVDVPAELHDFNLYEHVIYRCVVGSHAFGLAGPDSDPASLLSEAVGP